MHTLICSSRRDLSAHTHADTHTHTHTHTQTPLVPNGMYPLTNCVDGSPTWTEVGSDTECDTNAGEGYRGESSKVVSNIVACRKSCEEEKKCKSFTFFSISKWCSHFNTECKKTKSASNAISMRLGTAGTTRKPVTTSQGQWDAKHSSIRFDLM